MSNHLVNESSPYLLQHADQPVDWYPWVESALEKARDENKPIFLSIGYAACHWCHVMAHESFDDPAIAEFLNQHFISIKVDREERPDLDGIYMSSVVAMTGQGGWPMSIFLTPDGKPFYGGTYFPPEPRYGMPSFRQVIESISRSWEENREQVDQISSQLADRLQQETQISLPGLPIEPKILDQAAKSLVDTFDWETGGWGKAPKFPQPMAIDFLLGQATRQNEKALRVAVRSLDAMMAGGMHDLVGGGFHRYSTDANWLVPHFEKMLYDNAQLALAYLHGYQLTGKPAYRQVCEQTLEFIARELSDPQGGFYSSLDADSEGGEGAYYLWTPGEIEQAISEPELRELAISAFGVTPSGNHHGRTILRQSRSTGDLAGDLRISVDEANDRLAQARNLLFVYREKRPRPATDDKVITAWNALALRAFSEAGAVLQNRRYIEMAMRNTRFLLTQMRPDGRLIRAWRQGSGRQTAFLEDYAGLILALIAIYQADPQPDWYTSAAQLLSEILERFIDPDGDFFDTPSDQPTPLSRPRELQDSATPSGNAQAALSLLKLAEFTNRSEFRERAEAMLGPLQAAFARYPSAFSFWLQALDFAAGPVQEIAIIMDRTPDAFNPLAQAFYSAYRPRSVLAIASDPPPTGSPPLLDDRRLTRGKPTAYVCQGFTCRLPVTDVEEFKKQLNPAEESPSGSH